MKATTASICLWISSWALRYPTSFVAPLSGNSCCFISGPISSSFYFLILLSSFSLTFPIGHQNSIQNLFAPEVEFYEPLPSWKPILSSSYELRYAFVAMVWEQLFSGLDHENPHHHPRESEQLCSCLLILGMTQQTLKWKLFPFSLSERAKQWYAHTVEALTVLGINFRTIFVLTSS